MTNEAAGTAAPSRGVSSQDLRLLVLTVRYSLFPDSFDSNRIRRALGIGREYD